MHLTGSGDSTRSKDLPESWVNVGRGVINLRDEMPARAGQAVTRRSYHTIRVKNGHDDSSIILVRRDDVKGGRHAAAMNGRMHARLHTSTVAHGH